MLEKCVLTILELNWNQRLGHNKTKLNICHHMLTSSTQLQNRSFHVVERTRTSSKCQKIKNARAKRAKILFLIVKYANLWGFCCRRRRGFLSSLITSTDHITARKFNELTNTQKGACNWCSAGKTPFSSCGESALVYSQLVFLLLVGILNLLSLFQKWSACELVLELSALPL